MLIVIGICAIIYGRALPAFTDAEAAADLFLRGCQGDCANWHKERDGLRTYRYDFINLGSSLIITSLTLLALHSWLSNNRHKNISLWRSPSSKLQYFMIGTAICLGTTVGVILGLELDLVRNMFPIYSDSIAIPIFYNLMALPVILIISIIMGFIISFYFGALPVSLWEWDYEKPLKSWVITIVFGTLVLMFLILSLTIIFSSDFLVLCPLIMAIYICLASRAAILSP